MLIDEAAFNNMTDALVEQGIIQKFEQENGKITGKMMITAGELPEGSEIELDPNREAYVFNGSFDFYDSSVGVVLYLDPMEPVGNIWITPQVEDAEPPAKVWIKFFFKTLITSIEDDGTFGLPICSYVNDTADFTAVPARPS
ncbi:hypothetical protein [Ligilactobacillus animalis]|jgi:hypothetical protein|uniref:hypothetical protein n=1 Tax=Ligilactobacillus animalis TaxID=1605 RepID=UPI002598BBF7|nr:hypothetical protein [Ligilactobacillus animalis]